VIFEPTSLGGAWLLLPERRNDERGWFARTTCRNEFAEHGLTSDFVQTSAAYNHRAGTLRGMHYQRPPFREVKLVRCTRGAIWDVIIDLRRASPSCGRWQGFELSAENGRQLYVPEGFAHGYETLADQTEVSYAMSEYYAPGYDGGVRHDDPAFRIEWPLPVAVIAEKDRAWPDFRIADMEALEGPRQEG
jgi:dTDP-4-dehydrorhamnose 3,5-epimerase